MQMISEKRLRARDYIAGLAASGRYQFGSDEAQKALGKVMTLQLAAFPSNQ
jgi:hypothetical protein